MWFDLNKTQNKSPNSKPAKTCAGHNNVFFAARAAGLVGGDKRDRTADLLNAIQALSQLSYTPQSSALMIMQKT